MQHTMCPFGCGVVPNRPINIIAFTLQNLLGILPVDLQVNISQAGTKHCRRNHGNHRSGVRYLVYVLVILVQISFDLLS